MQSSARRSAPTRSAEIAGILRDEILTGQYRPGERLPSERDLSERFAASRSAVREALKALDQLGIASIRKGGARARAIEECTLDVLAPLLDLHDIPDPKLVDEVLQLIGVLMDTAARASIERATDQQIGEALQLIDNLIAAPGDELMQHEALRALGEFWIDVADHLVLRLMINGLRTSFLQRMHKRDTLPELDTDTLRRETRALRKAVVERDAVAVGAAMKALNRLIRESANQALTHARTPNARKLS